MDANTLTVLGIAATIVVGTIAASPGIYALILQKRKDKQEAPFSNWKNALDVANNAGTTVKNLQVELNEWKLRVIALEREVTNKNQYIEETIDKLNTANEEIGRQRAEIMALNQQMDILLKRDTSNKTRIDMLEAGYRTAIAEKRRLENYVKLCITEIQRCGGTVPELPPLEIENNGGKEMKP